MLSFCGQDYCSIDANGRVKFSSRFVRDFTEICSGKIVMHCLPESCVAVYPEDVYLEMRKQSSVSMNTLSTSIVARRQMRRFGALSQSANLTAQGRLTVPKAYREKCELVPGKTVVLVGAELGVEIWNEKRWSEELQKIDEHVNEKANREMADDLVYDSEQKI